MTCLPSSAPNPKDTMTDDDFSTRAIRVGQDFDPTTGAVIPPVYFTTTFVQDGIGGFRGGYEYARGGNPTRTSLETLIAGLEGGDRGFSFASGLAAEDTLLRAILSPGDHVLMGNDVYGGIAPAGESGLHPVGRLAVDRRDERPGCRARRDPTRRHEGGLARDPVEPAHEDHRYRGGRRVGARGRERSSWSTTPSPRPTCSSR